MERDLRFYEFVLLFFDFFENLFRLVTSILDWLNDIDKFSAREGISWRDQMQIVTVNLSACLQGELLFVVHNAVISVTKNGNQIVHENNLR